VRHIVYIGIAASALVVGAGAYVWKKLHSKCPTKTEMAGILSEIDSGRTGKNEAAAMALRFDDQKCSDAANAVRALLAKKYPTSGATPPPPPKTWPDTDPVCKAAIDALPTTPRPNPTGGAALPGFQQLARTAIADALSTSDARPIFNVADLLDSAASAALWTDWSLAGKYSAAATCLRKKAESSGMKLLAPIDTVTGRANTSAMALPTPALRGRLPARFAVRLRKTRQPVRGQ